MQENNSSLVISVDKNFNGNKKRNFFITTFLQGFLWMLFHFTVVFFFTFKLKSIVLVGVFLGFGNLISFLIDIPIGILQKYIKSKTLFLIGAISQLIAMIIFTLFIFQVTNYLAQIELGATIIDGVLSFFLGNFLNIILLLISAICYGVTQEINSVTSLSYVMNNVEPNKYGEILAKNNIFSGIGMFTGLITSGIIMSFGPQLIIFSLILIIAMIIFFMGKFFDNADESVKVSDIKNIKVSLQKISLNNVKEYISETIKAEDLNKIIQYGKYIFLKPKKIESSINFTKIIQESKTTFSVIIEILKQKPMNITIYWTMITILIFGFWDTFATTFLINFLDKVKPGWSYILLGMIAIPAFGLQEFFGKLATKIGTVKIALLGLIISGISIFFMGIFSFGKGSGALIIMICALLNSIGYSAGMSLGQGGFLDVYNKEYAKFMNLKEIDSNASAGPMKILQNIANVIGLMLGGFILGILQYTGFFIVFGILIIRIFIWSIKHKKEIKL